MMTGFITTQALALALLAAPVFAANENNYTYLALGDSVAFGYDPTVTAPAPAKFTGYPEIVAEIEHLLKSKKEVNAACPGETSSSFLIGGPDNGCAAFKANIGLHTAYTGTQASFAVSQLLNNKHINLVTLGIGGNDLLLLEKRCLNPLPFPTFADCVGANLPGVLQLYGQNIAQILTAFRAQAKYDRTLILVKQYSPSADPLFIQVVGAMNQVLMQVGAPFGAKFADGFTAFQLASAFFQGDPCKAGLLIHLNSTTCDVHPTPLGRNVLAVTVVFAIGDKGNHEEQSGEQSEER
jgi:lysophospholipase L1-like esterase